MAAEEKVVARYKDGSLVKGYVSNFRIDADMVRLRTPQAKEDHRVPINDLKAVFFVKTFKGYRDRIERKVFGIRKHNGSKVYLKFSDRESLLGYIDGEVPWDKGYSLAKLGKKAKGFYLLPVDSASNNSKIFVVGSAIKDITIMVA